MLASALDWSFQSFYCTFDYKTLIEGEKITQLCISSKFRKHFYLGSANFGSRGTTFTKELGMLVKDCPTLGEDARKIFDLYRSVDGLKKLPKRYPKYLRTKINDTHPVQVYNTKDDTIYKVIF